WRRAHGVVEPALAAALFAAHAKAPHPPSRGGDVPAFRRQVEFPLAIGDARARVRIECDRRHAARLLVLRVEKIGAALRAVIVIAAVGAGGSAPRSEERRGGEE